MVEGTWNRGKGNASFFRGRWRRLTAEVTHAVASMVVAPFLLGLRRFSLMRPLAPLFARPTFTPIAVESVRIQLFEQLVLCASMFERAICPQQNEGTFVGGHSHTSLEKR